MLRIHDRVHLGHAIQRQQFSANGGLWPPPGAGDHRFLEEECLTTCKASWWKGISLVLPFFGSFPATQSLSAGRRKPVMRRGSLWSGTARNLVSAPKERPAPSG